MNKLVLKYPKLGSSVDPTKLALTVKGIMVAIIPVAIVIAGAFGFSIDMTDSNTLADGVQKAILAVSSAISAVMFVWGLVRKIYVNR